MLMSGVLLAATPWCANFVLMLAVNGAVAFFWGIYETSKLMLHLVAFAGQTSTWWNAAHHS